MTFVDLGLFSQNHAKPESRFNDKFCAGTATVSSLVILKRHEYLRPMVMVQAQFVSVHHCSCITFRICTSRRSTFHPALATRFERSGDPFIGQLCYYMVQISTKNKDT